jgi:propionyl-CoA synthetase
MVREHVGPVAAFKHAITLPALPKTRSGKILRGLLLQIADGKTPSAPATIDNPQALQEAAEVIVQRWCKRRDGASGGG